VKTPVLLFVLNTAGRELHPISVLHELKFKIQVFENMLCSIKNGHSPTALPHSGSRGTSRPPQADCAVSAGEEKLGIVSFSPVVYQKAEVITFLWRSLFNFVKIDFK